MPEQGTAGNFGTGLREGPGARLQISQILSDGQMADNPAAGEDPETRPLEVIAALWISWDRFEARSRHGINNTKLLECIAEHMIRRLVKRLCQAFSRSWRRPIPGGRRAMCGRARRVRSFFRRVCHVAEPGTLGLANFEASRIQGRFAAGEPSAAGAPATDVEAWNEAARDSQMRQRSIV